MKGQLTIQGILITVITVIVLMVMAPLLYQTLSSVSGNATAYGDTITPTITSLIVPLLVLGVALVPVIYTLAGRRQNEQQ